jgi:hypothetical protein
MKTQVEVSGKTTIIFDAREILTIINAVRRGKTLMLCSGEFNVLFKVPNVEEIERIEDGS